MTHLKRWTLRSVIRTDVRCRAIPWTRLILEQNQAPDDLNLKAGQRVSVVLVALACVLLAASLVFAPFRFPALELAAIAILVVIALNRALCGFFVASEDFLHVRRRSASSAVLYSCARASRVGVVRLSAQKCSSAGAALQRNAVLSG